MRIKNNAISMDPKNTLSSNMNASEVGLINLLTELIFQVTRAM